MGTYTVTSALDEGGHLDKKEAWKLSQLYNRSKKSVTDTRIPLTATLLFTHKISLWTRFVRRLRSFSLFICCTNVDNEMADPMTRVDSVDAFRNEMQSLRADERPPVASVQRRRRNLSGSTRSLKIFQKRLSDKEKKKSG